MEKNTQKIEITLSDVFIEFSVRLRLDVVFISLFKNIIDKVNEASDKIILILHVSLIMQFFLLMSPIECNEYGVIA